MICLNFYRLEKSRRERKTIMRQSSTPNTSTMMQQHALNTQSPSEKQNIEVNSATDSNHDTALTLACAGGHEELVALLIKRKANIEHRDKKGFTPLILSATAGHEKVVSILLEGGAAVEAQSERTKDTPLSLACSGGRYEVVEILLNVGANKEHRNVSDYTPLSLAASGGYVNIIRLLLHHGAEINSRTGSKLGISPLMLAAMNGHTAAVKLLLDMGSDINAQIETNRNTALTLACFQGRHEVVSLLLDRKANVEHRAKTGLTPLMEAASGGYIEVGRVLLDKGADVNATPVPSSRDTALTIAADKGHLKFVELLLQRGAAVEVKNKKGNSPLWLAANGGHLNVVKNLKNHNADVDSQDNRRVSCLMAAFRKGHNKVVEYLVSHVTQFPSDQEMSRYIATISDKETADKCKDCVKFIRLAKEAQAVKANKNATILLEELDMEKNREENRRAAAARRRERKKKKKMEKKEEKRKQLESEQPAEDPKENTGKKKSSSSSSSSSSSTASNANESNKVAGNPEKEETDSGIDVHSHGQDSIVNGDNKSNASKAKPIEIVNKKNATARKDKDDAAPAASTDTKRKNQKGNNTATAATAITSTTNTNTTNPTSTTTATTTTTTTSTTTPSSNSNISKNPSKKNKSSNRTNESDEEKETNTKTHKHKENNKNQLNNVDNASDSKSSHQKEGKQRNTNDSNDRDKDKDKDKENVVAHNQHPSNRLKDKDRSHVGQNKGEHQADKSDGHDKSDVAVKVPVASGRLSSAIQHFDDASESAYFSSNRNKHIKTSAHQHEASSKSSAPVKQATAHGTQSMIAATRDAATPSSAVKPAFKREEGWKEVSRKSSAQQHTVSDISIKKIIIPTYAISRVIGRAGSNINAIRAATGAHIEVEKQGKSQNDRMITIKGTAEATKQASVLIGALVKDPDVDILQMLPKVNTNARSIPPANVIEKPAPAAQTAITASSASSSNLPATKVTTSKPAVTTVPTAAHRNQQTVSSNPNSASNSVNGDNKQSNTTARNLSHPIRGSLANEITVFKAPKVDPFPIVPPAVKAITSTVDHSSLTALKNTIKNTPSESFGTFAAKVAADTKPATASMSASTSEPANVHPSPKHAATSIPSSSMFVKPAIFTNDKITTKSTASTSSYSNTILSSGGGDVVTQPATALQNQIRPPITPIDKTLDATKNQEPSKGLDSSNRHENLQYSKVISRQLPIIPNSQSHEYSLFNISYTSAVNSQWEQNPTFNGRNSETYLESDILPKADASKAPGYRGANLNSPVNSKNLKATKADGKAIDTKNMDQKSDAKTVDYGKSKDTVEVLAEAIQTAKRDVLKLDVDDLQRVDKLIVDKDTVISDMDKSHISSAHISPIGTKLPIGSSLNIATSQSLNKPNTSVYGNTMNDSFPQSIMRQPNMQSISSAQEMLSQRSLSQSQLRSMSNAMDSMNLDGKNNPNFYDLSMLGLSNADSMPSYRPRMPSNQMPMSRLNPRASVFSSIQNNNPTGKNNNMPMMNQPYGRNDMFSQNMNQSMNTNYNPYQKMPFGNQNSGNAAGDRKLYGKLHHIITFFGQFSFNFASLLVFYRWLQSLSRTRTATIAA